ncbi:MAG: MSMEG_0565 family glycosyltransferase, partial [Rhodococcus sp. (in: high G+C Gram-positive bacteria)]
MKISLLTYSSKPRGGVVHTLALAEALARAGQDVSVWSLGRGGDSTFFRT